MAKIMKEDDNTKYWADVWKKSGMLDSKIHSKEQIEKSVVDWIDKEYYTGQGYHVPYQRQICIKIGGFRCLLNKYNKL